MQAKLLAFLLLLLSFTLVSCGGDDDDPTLTPSASFTISNDGCTGPCTVSFNSTGGNIESYLWEFHDGTASTQEDPSKEYTTAGNYTVKLTVTSSSGETDSETKTVTIAESDGNDEDAPVADFVVPSGVCLGECPTTFRNTSQNADSYQWDFGDGNTSTQVEPEHLYAQPGTYDVTLKAFADDGRFDQITKSIDVTHDNRPPCEIDNTTEIEFVCTSDNPYDVYVNNTFVVRLDGGTRQTWTFGAGAKNLRAEQVSGYLFTPTIVEATAAGEQCKAYQFVFPD